MAEALISHLDGFTPTFDQTMSRALVHKAGPEAVLVTDLVQLDEDHYLSAAQVPRAHAFFNDLRPPRHDGVDLAFLTELGRQAGISVLHRHLGVPLTYATVFLKLAITVVDRVPTEPTPMPLPATVQTTILNREMVDGVPQTVSFAFDYEVAGRHCAIAEGMTSAYSKADYAAMRTQMRAAKPLAGSVVPTVDRVAPDLVGRWLPDSVVIGALEPATAAGGYRSDVHVDLLHPHFFDHPMDHIPGVLMVEAFRQLGVMAAGAEHGLVPHGAVVTHANLRFTGFAELELPLACEAVVGTPRDADGDEVTVPLRVQLHQPGSGVVADGRIRIRGRCG